MGGEGQVIEADETYLGKRDGKQSKPDTFVSGFGWVKHPKIETSARSWRLSSAAVLPVHSWWTT